MFRLVLLKSPSIPLKKGDFYIQFPKKCFLQYSPPLVKGGWGDFSKWLARRLALQVSPFCHSGRREATVRNLGKKR
jgi:hypothetical protein